MSAAAEEYFISSGIAKILSQDLADGLDLKTESQIDIEVCLHEAKDDLNKLTSLLEPIYAHLSKRRVCWRQLSQLLSALCHRMHR
jgi:hypothetical protein